MGIQSMITFNMLFDTFSYVKVYLVLKLKSCYHMIPKKAKVPKNHYLIIFQLYNRKKKQQLLNHTPNQKNEKLNHYHNQVFINNSYLLNNSNNNNHHSNNHHYKLDHPEIIHIKYR